MEQATYQLCPRCLRAVPDKTGERYCANDGTKLISRCPACQTRIHNPYARHCTGCGLEFSSLIETRHGNLKTPTTAT